MLYSKEGNMETRKKGSHLNHLMFYPAEKMYQYQRAFLLQNSSR